MPLKRYAVHDGTFHPDEVAACAALGLAGHSFDVVRTRDPVILASCDMRIDVGGKYDPATGDYDHHGLDVGERNGVPYSSFGLIWKQFGLEICRGNQEAADNVDRRIVQGVDFRDLHKDKIVSTGPYQFTVSDFIKAQNSRWNKTIHSDTLFLAAVSIMEAALRSCVEEETAEISAIDYVRDFGVLCLGQKALRLPQWCPWQKGVKKYFPEVGYVIYLDPENGRWCTMKVSGKVSWYFSKAWRGKKDGELAELTGVKSALFCNEEGYMMTASDQEGALRLAEIMLEKMAAQEMQQSLRSTAAPQSVDSTIT